MRSKELCIVGNGSLGSFAALLIGKMASLFGWRMRFLDFDKVERHNLQNQLFREKDIGRHKSEALAELIAEMSSASPKAEVAKATELTPFRGAVVVLVDNMAAREAAWLACRYNYNVHFFVDARSGGDLALVYAFDPRDPDCVTRYEESLYGDTEADAAPCANPRQAPILFFVASVIGELLARYEEQFPERAEFIQTIISTTREGLPDLECWSYTGVSY